MKIYELMAFLLMSIMAIFFIVNIRFVSDTLEQRAINVGDFTEFGILFMALIIVIAFAVSIGKR